MECVGRVAAVALRWRGGARVVGGDTIEARLGLPSTWFTIRIVRTHGGEHVRHYAQAPRRHRRYLVVLSSTPVGDERPSGKHVARSDAFPGLRPGYWVVYRGPYATRAEAAQHAAGGYVRKLAT